MFEIHAQTPTPAPDTVEEAVPIDPLLVLSKIRSREGWPRRGDGDYPRSMRGEVAPEPARPAEAGGRA